MANLRGDDPCPLDLSADHPLPPPLASAPAGPQKSLVTLSLLPDTPLRERASSSRAATHPTPLITAPAAPVSVFPARAMPRDNPGDITVQLSLSSSFRNTDQMGSGSTKRAGLWDVMEADGGASFQMAWSQFATRNSGCSNPPLIDPSYLELTYGHSSDPVMLTDEVYEVLWCNVSFRKSMAERISRRQEERGAYVDELGVPTSLASFIFLKPEAMAAIPRCRAILWGFLKKMVFPKPSIMPIGPSGSVGGIVTCSPQVNGSAIYVECITEISTVFPVPKTLDIAKEHMEQSVLPWLISDTNNCVLWVNTAYKKMVGQVQKQDHSVAPELANTSTTQLTKDVALVFPNDRPPVDATSFSGRVKLHWFNVGNSHSLTTPCQVKRMLDKEIGELLLWTFHVSPLDPPERCEREGL